LISFECHLSFFCFRSVVGWLIIFSFYQHLKRRLLQQLDRFRFGMKCYHRHLILLPPGPRSLRRCYRLLALVFSFLFCYVLFAFRVQSSPILANLQVQNLRHRSLEQRCHVVSRLRRYLHVNHPNFLNQSSSYSLAPTQEQVWFCLLPSQLSLLFLISLMLYSF